MNTEIKLHNMKVNGRRMGELGEFEIPEHVCHTCVDDFTAAIKQKCKEDDRWVRSVEKRLAVLRSHGHALGCQCQQCTVFRKIVNEVALRDSIPE